MWKAGKTSSPKKGICCSSKTRRKRQWKRWWRRKEKSSKRDGRRYELKEIRVTIKEKRGGKEEDWRRKEKGKTKNRGIKMSRRVLKNWRET